MIKIEEFAFCFFSNDVDVVYEQEKELIKLTSKYQIERWYRHDRSNKYVSFSQMVNDAIDDTDSEIMIFCNPKTKFKSEDIEFILEKISNGYCFASVVNFGFFGFSKELIRHVGMLDETFIGGEYEDDDFVIRLLNFGRAIWLDYDMSKYDIYHSKSNNLRHITNSIFKNKYILTEDEILINQNLFSHKKISKRHRKSLNNISDSWMDKTQNFIHSKYDGYVNKKNITFTNITADNNIIDINLILRKKNSEYFIEMLSENSIELSIVFVKNIKDGRTLLDIKNIKNNTWISFDLFDKTQGEKYHSETEIRVFFQNNQLLNTILKTDDELKLNLRTTKEI